MNSERAFGIAQWLASNKPYEANYRDSFTSREFVEAWCVISDEVDRIPVVGDAGLEQFLWHAGHLLGDSIWSEEIEEELAVQAVTASRSIIVHCCVGTSPDWLGALMFWENVLGGRVSGRRGDRLWAAAAATLAALDRVDDPCVVESTRHGRQHFNRIETLWAAE
jgi:hypothetical protein